MLPLAIDWFTAKELSSCLRNDKMTLNKISNLFKFNSISYISRYTKRVLGLTPKEFREMKINNKDEQ